MESAHLVLSRPLGLFQPWMFGLKSKSLRTGTYICGGDVRTSVGGVVVRDDAVGCLVRSRILWLLMCCCQNTRRRHL